MTFDPKLTQRLDRRKVRPSSRKTYGQTWRQTGASAGTATADEVIAWLRGRVTPDTPIGTVMHERAAVKHALVSVYGLDEDEVDDIIPPVMGRPAPPRNHLSRAQLDRYFEEIGARSIPPAPRTILLLLPYTGMRISEVCGLRLGDIQYREGRRGFAFFGKGGVPRFVPLVPEAARILDGYMGPPAEDADKKAPLFEGREEGTTIHPEAVRKYTREIEAACPELGRLTPHVLRHTFATLAVQAAVNLREIQALLGHKDISTTALYAHTTPAALGASMDRIYNAGTVTADTDPAVKPAAEPEP